ncbi:uncharacterized protein UHOR_14721 [Ustilago hordei]|uniref:GAG-pre-integrase domain-containing protein n=1 Tax=Ustilago hordei TaxID=120017 RepID=I2FVP0_USTHO|nr:uncharacterized protein UHOR_14721 [Ustilago hordei]
MTTSTPLFDSVDEEFEHIKNEPKNSKQWLWHECLRHPGQDKSKAIIDKLNGKHIVELDLDTALTCSVKRATRPLDLIHINLIIDSSHVTEYMCTLVLVDDHSKIQQQAKQTGEKNEQEPWGKDADTLDAKETAKEILAICDLSGSIQDEPHSKC